MTDIQSLPANLPWPTPLPEAIARDVFGLTEFGNPCPDQDEVRAMTEEHAQAMIALLARLTHLEWCKKYSMDPDSGRQAASDHRQACLADKLQKEIAGFVQKYDSYVDGYAEAFGDAAAGSLDATVRQFVAERCSNAPPTVQKQLF